MAFGNWGEVLFCRDCDKPYKAYKGVDGVLASMEPCPHCGYLGPLFIGEDGYGHETRGYRTYYVRVCRYSKPVFSRMVDVLEMRPERYAFVDTRQEKRGIPCDTPPPTNSRQNGGLPGIEIGGIRVVRPEDY